MASEVGVAYLSVVPSARGFGTTLQRQVSGDLTRSSRTLGSQSGREYGRRFSSTARGIIGSGLGLAVAYGAARVAKESVNLEATFSRTMNRVAAATSTPRKELEGLERLALNLGARTTFSANEVSEAMLGLAKGGLTQAQIRAGALKDTLTLAAAGDLELKDAADATVASMGAFNLKGRETGRVASALAGAANASAADVSDLTQALSQAGTEANSVGFSVEETTAALAAFSNAGIQGSDAGTSLRTLLQRLVPTTKEARDAMSAYGLTTYSANRAAKVLAQDGIKTASSSYEDVSEAVGKYLVQQGVAEEGTVALEDATRKYLEATGIMHSDFTKQNGEFKSLAQISGELKKSLEDLPPAERSAALSAIFGSDARRAANVLIDEGAEGIRKYTKATSDLDAAEKMAGAATKGTAGALERLSGATETAQLKIGRGLAPTVRRGANALSDFLDDAPLERWARKFGQGLEDVGEALAPLGPDLKELGQDSWPLFLESAKLSHQLLKLMLPIIKETVEAFNNLPDAVQQALLLGLVARRLTGGGVVGGMLPLLTRGGAAAAGTAAGVGAGTVAAGGAAAGTAAGAASAGRFARFTGGARSAGLAGLAVVGGYGGVSWIQNLGEQAPKIDALGESLRNMGTFGAGKLPGEMEDLSDTVERLTSDSMAHRLERWAGSYDQEAEEVKNLDDAFVRLARERGLPAARRAFKAMAESEDLSHEETKALMQILPGYRRLLNGASDAADKHGVKLAGARKEGWDLLGLWKQNLLPTTKDLADRFGLTTREAGLLRGKLSDTTGTAKQHEKQLREVARQLGLNKQETEDLIKKYGDVPKKVETRAEFLTAEAERKRDAFLERTKGKFSDLGNDTYAIMVNGTSGHGRIFAQGGFFERHDAQIGDGITRVWNEPETGGESYIPLHPSKRKRSLGIWAETGKRLGVEGFADGGITGRMNTKVELNLSRLNAMVDRLAQRLSFAGGNFPHDYRKVGFRGVTMDRRSVLMLRAAEKLLGQQFHLTQGSYSTGVSASGGTHDGGGAFDATSPFSRAAIVALRRVGWAAWRRYPYQGPWPNHIHSIDPLNRMLSPAARSQAQAFRAGGDGLGGTDYEPRPSVIGNVLRGGGSVRGGSPRAIVRAMAAQRGWGGARQWDALNRLIASESSWNPNAQNPTSSAAGLFQKMTSIHGPLEPTVQGQARWGLNYIAQRYGGPIPAWNFKMNHGWYDQGGVLKPGLTMAYNGTGQNEYVVKQPPRNGVQRFVLDIGGGRVLTGVIDDRIDGTAEHQASVTRMGSRS